MLETAQARSQQVGGVLQTEARCKRELLMAPFAGPLAKQTTNWKP